MLVSKAAGGTDIIFKLNANLVPAGIDRVAWIDAHGYDAWPATACLEANWQHCVGNLFGLEYADKI